jgi:hypothetical protein
MLTAFLIILLITAGGTAVTYLYDKAAPLYVRVAAGAVLGNTLLALVGFIFLQIFGLSKISVVLAVFVCTFPFLLVLHRNLRSILIRDINNFQHEWNYFFRNINFARATVALAYSGLAVMLWLFFERAMLYVRGGIGTGSTHNIGDLPFHLAVINGFTQRVGFPPENPIYAGGTFSYPYMSDFGAALLCILEVDVKTAMFAQNISLGWSLVVLLAYFTYKLTNNLFAALLAPFLLLFDGGFGFVLFFQEAVKSESGIIGQLFNLTNDYTIRNATGWRWGNSLTALFLTQRGLLLGLPLALIILTKIWEIFSRTKKSETAEKITPSPSHPFTLSPLIIGLLAGMLPLVHAHTFAVVMGATAVLAVMSLTKWREWIFFFAGAGLVAVPELLIATVGSPTKAESFIGWEFGWDNGEENPFWFWFKNTGLFLPLLGGVLVLLFRQWFVNNSNNVSEEETAPADTITTTENAKNLLLFYAPFALCFIIPNMVKLAPWIWDNVKVLIYWYVASVPLVALLLAYLWRRGEVGKLAAAGLILTLTLAGWLDVWRIASRQWEYQIMPPEAITLATQIKERTPPRALLMTAPEYASVAVLTGRKWFLGYVGHVWSQGVNPAERENVIRQIYAGGAEAEMLIEQYGIDYVVISPLERKFTAVNEEFFKQYQVIAEAGEHRVYRVDSSSPSQ